MFNQPLFEKNLAVLKENNLIFAQKIQNTNLSEEYQLIPAQKTGTTLKVKNIFFHSKFTPMEEAQRLCAKEDFSQKELLIICGLGLGYLAQAVYQKYPKHLILIIEKDWHILNAALQVTDFSAMLASQKVEIILPESPELILDYLQLYQTRKIGVFFHRPSFDFYPEFYSEIKNIISRFIATREINQATLNRFEKLWFKNMLLNLGTYIQTNGVNEFFAQYQNKPVFLVGAGPSLKKQLPILKTIQHQYLLIAVNTSLPYLTANGIFPDFVVTVDPQDKVYRYFLPVIREKLESYPILIAEPTICPKIVKNYPGRIMFCNVGFLKNWVGQFAGEKGELEMGGSVITAAYLLAVKMQASPIVLLGTDMSYSQNTLHFKGAELEKEWLFTQTRFESQEQKQYSFIKKMRLFPHEGFYGNTVFTDSKFITYIEWLEKNFKKYPQYPVINATEGGIAFKGIENRSLMSVLKELETQEKNIKSNIAYQYLAPNYSANRENFLAVLSTLDRELPLLGKAASQGLEISKKLYLNTRQRKQPDLKLFQKLNQIDTQLASFHFSEIISLGLQKIIQDIAEEAESQYTEEEKASPELKAFKSSILLYSAIEESVIFNLQQIKKARIYLEFSRLKYQSADSS